MDRLAETSNQVRQGEAKSSGDGHQHAEVSKEVKESCQATVRSKNDRVQLRWRIAGSKHSC